MLGGRDWRVALCEPDTHAFILKINTEHLPFARLWIKSLNILKKSKAWLCLPKRTRKGKRKSCHLWGTYSVQGHVLSTVHTLSNVSLLPRGLHCEVGIPMPMYMRKLRPGRQSQCCGHLSHELTRGRNGSLCLFNWKP